MFPLPEESHSSRDSRRESSPRAAAAAAQLLATDALSSPPIVALRQRFMSLCISILLAQPTSQSASLLIDCRPSVLEPGREWLLCARPLAAEWRPSLRHFSPLFQLPRLRC